MKAYFRRLWRSILARPLSPAEEVDRQDGIKARLASVARALSDEIGKEIEIAWDVHSNFLVLFSYGSYWAVVTQFSIEDLASKKSAEALSKALDKLTGFGPHGLATYSVPKVVQA